MSKRFKYFISALFSTLGFFMFISLPFESRYFGLMAGVVMVIFCYWFGLGIIFDESFHNRILSILLPVSFFVGFGMFVAFLPYSLVTSIIYSLFFGIISYGLFLVENVFLVAIGFKTVPLYRAAYTVGLIVLLLATFFLFDCLFSFRLNLWWNTLAVFIIGLISFSFLHWSVTIELSDGGKGKSMQNYVVVPSLVLAQLALALGFWPVGIFKGSVYLVSAIYLMSGLLQADIRDRLFRRVWLMYTWIAVAILLAMVIITRWR